MALIPCRWRQDYPITIETTLIQKGDIVDLPEEEVAVWRDHPRASLLFEVVADYPTEEGAAPAAPTAALGADTLAATPSAAPPPPDPSPESLPSDPAPPPSDPTPPPSN